MKLQRKIFVLLIFLSLISGSCMDFKQPRNKVEFYTLEYDPPLFEGLSPVPCVIRLKRFNVSPIYNSNKIIYRDQSFKRESYFYHKWQANPGDLVSHLLCRDIRRSGLFKAILPHDSTLFASHVLEGTVDDIFEYDMDESWKAVLSVSIVLMIENGASSSKDILFQKTYNVTSLCKQKRPEALVAAMSHAIKMLSKQIIEDIYHVVD